MMVFNIAQVRNGPVQRSPHCGSLAKGACLLVRSQGTGPICLTALQIGPYTTGSTLLALDRLRFPTCAARSSCVITLFQVMLWSLFWTFTFSRSFSVFKYSILTR